MEPCKSSKKNCNAAKWRWGILANAIRSNQNKNNCNNLSKREFKGFELFKTAVSYQTKINNQIYSILINEFKPSTYNDIFNACDNTGNVCVWPSEEILAYYMLKNSELFYDKTVLELGSGASGLASLLAWKYIPLKQIHITDGNEKAIENIKRSVLLNSSDENDKKSIVNSSDNIKCFRLVWQGAHEDNESNIAALYNVIISADCVYFEKSRQHLIATISKFLHPDGIAYVMAPQRAPTLDQFIEIVAKNGFVCVSRLYYDNDVTNRHQQLSQIDSMYCEDIHYPVLVTMKRIKQSAIVTE